jgi:hypothetical protein
MSATGRSDVRHPDDFYSTPPWATRAILPHLVTPLTYPLPSNIVFDPCCGDGAILFEVANAWHMARLHGIEIDESRCAMARRRFAHIRQADALRLTTWCGSDDRASLILTNPPYSLASDFIRRALREVEHGGQIAMLLRLGATSPPRVRTVRTAPRRRGTTRAYLPRSSPPIRTVEGARQRRGASSGRGRGATAARDPRRAI